MTLGLDFEAGAKIAQREQFGDWYRDPWGWPEFAWVNGNASKLDADELILKSRSEIKLRTPAEFHLIEVPKTRLSVRPAVVQDVPSRLIYLSAVASKLPGLHVSLPELVFGWRSRGETALGDNRVEWPTYLASLQESKQGEWGLQADITSFFASIKLDRMTALVYEKFGKTAAAELIVDITHTHDKLTTRSGLPQRSFASAALAHLYLGPLDDVIADALRSGSIRVAARWMDDINAIGSENALYKLHIRLQERARQLGLELNPAKSILARAEQLKMNISLENLREIILPVKINAGYDTPAFEPDPERLHQLEDHILQGKISHPTAIRATLHSLRQHKQFDRYMEWATAGHRIPHLAEPLGRYLRAAATSASRDDTRSTTWPALATWLRDTRAAGWAVPDWVDAQFSLIFPAEEMQETERANLREWLAASTKLQKIAIAAQRLAAVESSTCRDLIRSRVDHVADSLMLRVLALGLLSAGDDRRAVQAILDRDQRNSILVQVLKDRNWRPFDVAAGFDSDPEIGPGD